MPETGLLHTSFIDAFSEEFYSLMEAAFESKPKFLRYLAAGLPRLIGHRLRGRLYDDRLERLLDLTPRAPAPA